jgi:hypothetical protein
MKNSYRIIQFMFLLASCAFALPVYADVKIKTRQTSQGQTSESVTMIKGKRLRSENAGGMISLNQCDLRRNVQIMPEAKVYKIDSFDVPYEQSTEVNASGQSTPVTKGGTINGVVELKDTGERKQMFGYTARRIITTVTYESTPDACTPMKNKMQTDGWYIDAKFPFNCDNDLRYKNYQPAARGGCRDKYVMKEIGAGKKGYPVWEKMTMFDDNGKETYSFINEVIELSNATLDAALFDIPAGYTEVKDFNGAYSAMAASSGNGSSSTMSSNSSSTSAGDAPSNSGLSSNVKNMSNATSNVSTTVGAKKPGVTRVGLATVKTGAVGEGMNAAQLASAIGNSLAEYLKAPNIELVQIEARLASQIDAEAKQKECDFVVYTNVAHKKGGGGGFGGMFGKAAGGMLGNVIPMAGGTGAAIAANVATTAVYTAASMSANVKSKDEITLDIKVNAPGNATPAFARQFKAKAKSDGEDIISPLIEQAAQAIMDTATKK